MWEEAGRVVKDGAFTLPEVLAEVTYVRKGVYKVERTEIAATPMGFLDDKVMSFDKKTE